MGTKTKNTVEIDREIAESVTALLDRVVYGIPPTKEEKDRLFALSSEIRKAVMASPQAA